MDREWKWDWWGESPVELVLVVLVLSFFFAFPRTGLGITEVDGSIPAPAALVAE